MQLEIRLVLLLLCTSTLHAQQAKEEAFKNILNNNIRLLEGKLKSGQADLLGCPMVRLTMDYRLEENKDNGTYKARFTFKWVRKADTDINCAFRATDWVPFNLFLRAENPAKPAENYEVMIQDRYMVFKPQENELFFDITYQHKSWPEGIRFTDFRIFSEQAAFLEHYRFQHPKFSAFFYPERPFFSNYRDGVEILTANLETGTFIDLEQGVRSVYTRKKNYAIKIGLYSSGEANLADFIKKHKGDYLSLRWKLLEGKEYAAQEGVWKERPYRDVFTYISEVKGSKGFFFHRFVALGKGQFMVIYIPYRNVPDALLGADTNTGLAHLKTEMVIFQDFLNSFKFKP